MFEIRGLEVILLFRGLEEGVSLGSWYDFISGILKVIGKYYFFRVVGLFWVALGYGRGWEVGFLVMGFLV